MVIIIWLPFDKRLKKLCTSENLSAGVQCMHFQLKQERMDLQFEWSDKESDKAKIYKTFP